MGVLSSKAFCCFRFDRVGVVKLYRVCGLLLVCVISWLCNLLLTVLISSILYVSLMPKPVSLSFLSLFFSLQYKFKAFLLLMICLLLKR